MSNLGTDKLKGIIMNLKLTALATLLCSSTAFAAIPYKNEQYQFSQPNGEVITLTLNGNSYYAEQRTVDGRLVVFDNALKGMVYAKLNDEGSELISTGVLVSTPMVSPGPLLI